MAEYKVPVTDRFEVMLIGAERYACGRRTYIVSETVNYIVSLLPHLSMSTLLVFQNDMMTMQRTAEWGGDGVWGNECDRLEWERFAKKVNKELERRTGNG